MRWSGKFNLNWRAFQARIMKWPLGGSYAEQFPEGAGWEEAGRRVRKLNVETKVRVHS